MNTCLRNLYDQLGAMDHEQMEEAFRKVLEAYSETLARADMLEAAQTDMSREYRQMKEDLQKIQQENEFLKQENLRLTEQLSLRKRDLFGAATEKTEAVLEKALSESEDEDPLQDEELREGEPADLRTLKNLLGKKTKRGKKAKGKRETDLSALPKKTEYLLDIDSLDALYGKGNWGIYNWTEYRTIESIRPVKYLKCVFVPVISAGLEHELVRVPYEGKLLKRSLISESLLAEMMYNKVLLSLPFYRQEADLLRDGVVISRDSMSSWCIRFTHELFTPIYDYLCLKIFERRYSQSDETTLQVISDGRKSTSLSYFWVHTTSELDEGPGIIVFSYELTRSTRHLRDTYLLQGFHGFLTSDAYASYGLLEKEANGSIISCGCFMHARRKFVMALMVMDLRKMTEEQILELPEFKAQRLIDEIFQEETPLKQLEAEERLKKRQINVKPRVDAFFDYLHEIDQSQEMAYSSRFLEAVNYSLNNERQLRVFLDDPRIPMDNGFAERSIRPYACGRRNWLFCYSIEGAEALAILYTLAETAKASGAHPYYYYKYLLKKMPLRMNQASYCREDLEDMMPWSDAYRSYEAEEKANAVAFIIGNEPVLPPKSPKQNRRPMSFTSF